MVAYLEKSTKNADFAKIVDFLNSSHIRPTILVADETVHEERGDKVERIATTASSLEAKQNSGIGSGPRVLDLENVNDAQAFTVTTPVTTAGVSVSTAEPSTPPTTTTTLIEDKDLTIDQTLIKMRSVKSK
nr:hypothetical protein [Tanacetum cinerariifolium]